jgi:hypothetical protein
MLQYGGADGCKPCLHVVVKAHEFRLASGGSSTPASCRAGEDVLVAVSKSIEWVTCEHRRHDVPIPRLLNRGINIFLREPEFEWIEWHVRIDGLRPDSGDLGARIRRPSAVAKQRAAACSEKPRLRAYFRANGNTGWRRQARLSVAEGG